MARHDERGLTFVEVLRDVSRRRRRGSRRHVAGGGLLGVSLPSVADGT
jgi:hypothetical protein